VDMINRGEDGVWGTFCGASVSFKNLSGKYKVSGVFWLPQAVN